MSDLRRLRYFLAVAEERNVTRAAERLHVAQPALSRQVRQLEQELGVELLERGPQGVTPTEAGQLLMERGAALCEEADQLWRDVRGFAAGERGTLAFGYSTSTGYETAPALLAAYAGRHPGITLDTRLLPTSEIVAGVADRTLDAGLVRCPPPTPELVRTLVRLERQGVLLAADHPLAAPTPSADNGVHDTGGHDTGALTPLTVAQLATEQILLHPRPANPGHYDAVTAIFTRAGIQPRVLLRALSFDVAHTPVASGAAVAVVGESARAGLAAGLVWRPLEGAPPVEVHLLTRGPAPRPATVRLLRAAAETARAHGWLRAG
jgi:DNA-binding transcriptional LysR family regulator